MDNNELLIKLEKEFQKEFEAQKNLYESRLELLKSEFENYKKRTELEAENKINTVKEKMQQDFDVKSTSDAAEIKSYYENQLQSQKEWYEKEIQRRIKETENWHIKNLEKVIKEKEEKFNQEKNALNCIIEEQKIIYEEQLRPYKDIINLINKVKKKLKFKGSQKSIKTPAPLEGLCRTKGCGAAFCERCDGGGSASLIQPKVSVILPIYNVGKYLSQSLDSIINQTLKDIEIICINDGSTDNSLEILREYEKKDNRIKVINKSNKGTGAARNDGLRTAIGECIAFVDPDDFIKPEMFERLYNLIKEKNLDIAMCMPDGFDEKNNKYAPFPYFTDDNFNNIPVNKVFNKFDISPFKYPMCVWNKLYTKKLFDDNNIEFAEGLDFEDHKAIFGTLLTAERMYFIKEKLYVYRYNREGSILTDNNRRLIDHIKIFDIVEELMKKTNTFNDFRNDFLEYKIHNILYYYGMIKDEFKRDYYAAMVKSLKETNLSNEEYKILSSKYPELKNIIK